MDWRVAWHFTVIIVAAFAGAVLAIWVFDAVWARVGIGAAVLLLAFGLYLVKRSSDKKADRAREGWERSS